MEKPTKRKAFNFLRSYFDVVNELQNDSDKLSFLMAVINKQFLDEDPKDMSFLVKLCYSSQKHAIESSVKGWKRVANTDMEGNPLLNTTHIPQTNPTSNPTTNPIQVEEKEKEKEQVEVKDKNISLSLESDFNIFWNTYNKKVDLEKCRKKFLKLPKKDITKILEVVEIYVKSTPEKKYRKNPYTWLNGSCWNDFIENTNIDIKKKYEVSNAFGKEIVYKTENEIKELSKNNFNTIKLLE